MVNSEVPHFSTAAPLGATRRTFHPPFTGLPVSQSLMPPIVSYCDETSRKHIVDILHAEWPGLLPVLENEDLHILGATDSEWRV